jgi:hypothetical protein
MVGRLWGTMKNAPTSLSRRRFLGAASAGAAISIVSRHVLGGPGQTPPSEVTNIAVIGVGGQGVTNTAAANRLVKPEYRKGWSL